MRKYINNHTYIFLIVFFFVSIIIYQKKNESIQVNFNKHESSPIEKIIVSEAEEPIPKRDARSKEIGSIANAATTETKTFNTSSEKGENHISVGDSVQENPRSPASEYIRLGKKYSDQLPKLFSAEIAGNYIDINSTFNLLKRSVNGESDTKLKYEEILNDLKIHADAGDVRAQQDYAMFLTLNAGSFSANLNASQKIAFAELAKNYYAKAASSGQARAAVNISNNAAMLDLIKDPEEALAWGFIAKKMGERPADLVVCIDNSFICTEEMFAKALELAKFYIDFYEFKLDK